MATTAQNAAPPRTAATGSGWCALCYLAAVERLVRGFVIRYQDGKTTILVPPLTANQAADVRRAARAHIERHGQGGTARHSQHAGGRA